MKPLLFTLLSLAISTTQLQSQCHMPDGNFEQWQDATDTIQFEMGFDLIETVQLPGRFFPIVRLTFLATASVTEPYFDSGVADVALFSGLKMVTPGANGSATAAQLSGDSLEVIMDLLSKQECGERPSSLQGYFRYSGDDGDSLTISALFGSEKSPVDIVTAEAGFEFKTAGGPAEFTFFEVPITFDDDDYIPAFASLKILTEKIGSGSESFFEVDELELVGTTTSQRDFIVENHALLAPNPFHSYLDVDATQDIRSLVITDVQGRQVKSFKNPKETLLIHDLPSGTYFARATTAHEVLVQRIVKL